MRDQLLKSLTTVSPGTAIRGEAWSRCVPPLTKEIPLKTALYARVSTTDQKGASPIARLNQWAKEERRKVAVKKIDNVTGKNLRQSGSKLVCSYRSVTRSHWPSPGISSLRTGSPPSTTGRRGS